MKPQTTNQEILLVTGTRFCKRSFCKLEAENNEACNYSFMEELERVCRDGVLNKLLPELTGNRLLRNGSFIWNTASGVNFLCITMGSYPASVKKETSIDPYWFLSLSFYN